MVDSLAQSAVESFVDVSLIVTNAINCLHCVKISAATGATVVRTFPSEITCSVNRCFRSIFEFVVNSSVVIKCLATYSPNNDTHEDESSY